MAYKHGVYISEVPTSILPPVTVDSAIPVFVGTAPLHLSKTGAAADLNKKVNYPILCHTYDEAVDALGLARFANWGYYTLSECIKSQFSLFGVGPAIFINVLDPDNIAHKEAVSDTSFNVTDGAVKIDEAVIASTVVVKLTSAGNALVAGTDYSVSYDQLGRCIINMLAGGDAADAESVYISYTRLKPLGVTNNDVIGGYDSATGRYKGLSAIHQIYSMYGVVPASIAAPRFSRYASVGAAMNAISESVSGRFKALSLLDLDSYAATGASEYSAAPAQKSQANFVNRQQVVCWPRAQLGGEKYYLSTLLAGLLGTTDHEWRDVPVKSPSKMPLPIDGLCNLDNDEINLTQTQANYLNGQGIATALNAGGWCFWGNRTAAYPASTDPKDVFIPIRRMFNWISNTLITTWLQRLDFPIVRRTIDTMVDSINIWLNGLAAQECLVGRPRVEFLESENPVTNLLDGIIALHVYITPPAPMRELDFVLEYDVKQLETLFASE